MSKRLMTRLPLWFSLALAGFGCQNRPPAGSAGTLPDAPELRAAKASENDRGAQERAERPAEPAYGGAAAAADAPVVRVEALDGPHPPTGRPCRVQFRRDALGQAAPAPLGVVVVGTPAGRAAQLAGVLDQVTPDWLVVRAGRRTYWIARGNVLLVEFDDDDDDDDDGDNIRQR